MATKQSTPAKKTSTQYVSNPFRLGFDALNRLFRTNSTWAIVLVVVSSIGFVTQFSSTGGSTNTQPVNQTSALASTTHYDATTIIALVVFLSVLALAAIVVVSVIGTYIKGMFSYVALESEKGKSATFSQAFKAVSERFWRLLWAEVLAVVKIIGWTCLFIIPGIVAAYRYALLAYVIMDEPTNEKGITASHARVKALVAHRKREVFGISTVSIIPIVGSAIGYSGNAALYRQLQVYTDKKLEKPGIHWLNYIGFAFFALIMSLAVIVAIAIS